MLRFDFELSHHGSIVLLQPLSAAGREWIETHLPEDRLTYAGAVAIEPRYLLDIFHGIADAGLLTVQYAPPTRDANHLFSPFDGD